MLNFNNTLFFKDFFYGLITHSIQTCLLLFSFYGISQTVSISKFGFTGIDDTAIIKLAIHSPNDTIIFDKQASPWVIGPLRFNLLRNKVLIFEKGTVLKAKLGSYPRKTDALLAFDDAQNIKIFGNGATLVMNKEEYIDGEWRHGISLRNCKNMLIDNVIIKDSGGDGIFIDGTTKLNFSENITIKNVLCDNNKRQGISVISVKNLKVSQCTFQNTKGTLPGAGVDLEPDHKENRLENIVFEHCVFKNNDHAGISLALHNLETDSAPVSIRFENCVLQNNHSKDNAYIATEIFVAAHKTRPVQGAVVFEKCLVENSKWGLLYSRKTSDAYSVTFKDCTARNICLDNTYPAIYLEVTDYYSGSYSLGGFYFENLLLAYETEVPFFQVRGSKLGTLAQVEQIIGDITLKSRHVKVSSYLQYDSSNNKNFHLNVTQKAN